MRRPSQSTEIDIATAFRADRSRTRRPTHAFSTTSSRRWAAQVSSDRRPISIPRPSTGSIPGADDLMLRAVSIAFFIGAWYLGSEFAGERMLPGPLSVLSAILTEARSGTLFMDLAVTLARVTLAFLFALAAGTAIGLLMGRVALADRLGDPWLVLLLNLPALVVIVLAYIWGGLTEAAAIAAVAANK